MRHALTRGLLVVVLATSTALAADKSIPMPSDHAHATLKPGPAVEVARQQCVLCHSTDSIVMQPRGEDVKTIVEYLATQYGK